MTEIIYSLVLGSPFPPIPGLFLDIKQKLLSEESRTLTKITTRCGVSWYSDPVVRGTMACGTG